MSLINRPDNFTSLPTDTSPAPKNNPFKWVALGVGGVIAFAHIGVLGHLIKKEPPVQSAPTINLPRGPYSSCLLYTSPSPRDVEESRMPSSA